MSVDARWLAVASVVALALLVAHSRRALGGRRAFAFWVAIAAYGWVRHRALEAIAAEALDGRFPYRLERPRALVAGVPLQEIAGWAIALALAWWLGERLARGERADAVAGRGVVVAGAALALAALSWAIESAAGAAGWWTWSVAAGPRWLHGVPAVGLVDWAAVAADFLLPYLVWTKRPPAPLAVRVAALALFPLHFAAHASFTPLGSGLVAADLAHWALLAGGLALAFGWRSEGATVSFASAGDRLPLAALALVGGVAGLVLATRAPRALSALVPLAGIVLAARAPRPALALAAAAAALGVFVDPGFYVGALATAVALALTHFAIGPAWSRRLEFVALGVLLILISLAALTVGRRAARDEAALRQGLDGALALRDRGDLAGALASFARLENEHPSSPAPASFAGEIRYRQGALAEATDDFARSFARQAHPRAARFVAVIALRQGDRARAVEWVERGLLVAPHDRDLLYLAARARGAAYELPAAIDVDGAAALVALAFEVGDREGARRLLEAALERHPEAPRLREVARRLAAVASRGAAAGAEAGDSVAGA